MNNGKQMMMRMMRQPSEGSPVKILRLRRMLPRGLIICIILWIAVIWSTALSTQQHVNTLLDDRNNWGTSSNNKNQHSTKPSVASLTIRNETRQEIYFRHNHSLLSGKPMLTHELEGIDMDVVVDFLVGSSSASLHRPSSSNHSWWSPLVRETICFDQSRLVTATDDASLWTTRLVYLAVYQHQYEPSFLRINYEDNMQEQQQLQPSAIQSMSPHCHPDTKYLVTSLSEKGIGANFRLTAVSALKAALATNRVLLLVNNISSATTQHGFLHEPWALASCPRGDVECFFRPITLCSVPLQEIAQAHVLTRPETRTLFRHGQLPANSDRVVAIPASFLARPQRNPPQLQSVLYNISLSILERHRPTWKNDGSNPAIRQGLERLVQPDPESTNGMFRGDYQISNALMMFALRPLPRYSREIHRITQTVLRRPPGSKQQEQQQSAWQRSIGLPIRASDKCDTESTCLSAEQYVRAAKEMWQHSWVNTTTAQHTRYKMTRSNISTRFSTQDDDKLEIPLLVTSEDKRILDETAHVLQHNTTSSNGSSWAFRLIENPLDVSQGTGALKALDTAHSTIGDKEAMMVSALSSLQLQMATRYSLVNCCSNFHKLLKDFLDEGCGLQESNTLQCLETHPNPSLRICCAWGEHQCESFHRKTNK